MTDEPKEVIQYKNGVIVDPVTHRFVKGPVSAMQKQAKAEKKQQRQEMAASAARSGFKRAMEEATRDQPGRFTQSVAGLPGALEAKTEIITTEIFLDPDTKGRDRIAAADYLDKVMDLAAPKQVAQQAVENGVGLHMDGEPANRFVELLAQFAASRMTDIRGND